MSFDADLNACAALVERGDPLRFRATMAAPVTARRVLFPIYAFNVEVSRAPWITQEPMIAEMRLQWWRDVCDEIAQGGPVRRHEVATPLASVISSDDARLLDTLVAARRWDIYKDPFDDDAHFNTSLDQTAGHLTWVAARCLGAADPRPVRAAAHAFAVATWLRAIPALEDQGRIPLLDGRSTAITALAQHGLARLAAARSVRRAVPPTARAALLHIGPAKRMLQIAIRNPTAVADGTLPDLVEIDRLGLTFRALSGLW